MTLLEIGLLFLLLFAVAGDPPPAINEAHYMLKAKHFWEPDFLGNDLFVASRGAHSFFFFTIGWLTTVFSLETATWIARCAGWLLLAVGMQRLGAVFLPLFDAAGRNRVRFAIIPIAAVWIAGVSRCNLAGEWIVGGIEAKVFAYGFVLMGTAKLTQSRWTSVWIFLGIASAFHVLVGGWAVVGAMVIRASDLRGSNKVPFTRNELFTLFLGGTISLFGLVPALQLSAGSTPEEQLTAMRNYVYGRISHHLSPAAFPWEWYVRHGILLVLTLASGWMLLPRVPKEQRRSAYRILGFLATGPALAAIGLALGILPALSPDLGAKLLRFYWFRMTDAYVPLAMGLICVGWMLQTPGEGTRQWRWLSLATLSLSGIIVGYDCLAQLRTDIPPAVLTAHDVDQPDAKATDLETRRSIYEDWLHVCQFVREQSPIDAVFVTPRAQHTFKWYARRAEVVNWKDVPQDVASGIEWARRFNATFPRELKRRHPPGDVDALQQIGEKYGATHLLIDRRIMDPPSGLQRLYPGTDVSNQTYEVYSLTH